jgi:hypothetical protein
MRTLGGSLALHIGGLFREAARMLGSFMREKPHAVGGRWSIAGFRETLANRRRWLIPAMAFAGAALHYFPNRPPGPRPLNEQSEPQAILASVKTSLGLDAERRGDDLLLYWNRESAAIASAVTGILVIQTGDDHEDFVLSPQDLHSGRFIHRSTASLVNIRLHVFDWNDNQTTDSLDFSLSRKSDRRPALFSRPTANPPVASDMPSTHARTQPKVVSAADRVGNVRRDGTMMLRPHHSGLALIRQVKPETRVPVTGRLPLENPPFIEPPFFPSPIAVSGLLEQGALATPHSDTALGSSPVISQSVLASPLRRLVTAVPLVKKLRHDSDFVPPTPIRTSSPEIPASLRQNLKRGFSVDVKVYVNSSGEVQYAELLSNGMGPDRDIASLAVFESRRWKFHPAHRGGQPSDGEVILHYRFSPARVDPRH